MATQLTDKYQLLKDRFTLLENEPMSRHTSFKVGGPADLFAMPECEQDLTALITAANQLTIPVTIIGGGSNLLVRDRGIRGLVICLSKMVNNIQASTKDGNTFELSVLAGCRLSTLCLFAIDNALTGLEFAAGIPGTVGGAVKMNAGTIWGSMSDIVAGIKTVNKTSLKIRKIDRGKLTFRYRKLDFEDINNLVITEVLIRLEKGNVENIKENYYRYLEKRNVSQPVAHASAGCFFKNPEQGKSAGEMIDLCGLKSKQVGQAMVSEKHANYIVNKGNATCEDILLLCREVVKTVREKFNVTLKTEVIIEGE